MLPEQPQLFSSVCSFCEKLQITDYRFYRKVVLERCSWCLKSLQITDYRFSRVVFFKSVQITDYRFSRRVVFKSVQITDYRFLQMSSFQKWLLKYLFLSKSLPIQTTDFAKSVRMNTSCCVMLDVSQEYLFQFNGSRAF